MASPIAGSPAMKYGSSDTLPSLIMLYAVKAGINETHLIESNDPCSKLFYDFYYIKHFSPWLDALTVLRLFTKFADRRICKN